MANGFSISDLESGYRNLKVIESLNLPEVPEGTVTGLLGPNGAGKSTLLKALAGLQPFTGTIKLRTNNLSTLSADERLEHIGYLPQSLPLSSSLLVYESILSSCRVANRSLNNTEIEQRIEQVLETLGIYQEAFKGVRELSGGKRQLVGLAQVLVRNPDLMLLDEPTSALDLKHQIQVFDYIRRITKTKNSFAIISAHDINLAMRFCDNIIVLSDGKALACGKPEDVITPAILQQVYGVEARVERCSRGYPIVLADSVSDMPPN